jgi:DNA polymerase-4
MGRSADVPRAADQLGGDDSGCTIVHVDMDAFFASVEIRRRPELAGRPVVVGGGTRGVVAAASYAARRYGVRSAMPMSRALRLCPKLVVLPPDRAAYTAASAVVMGILRSITPLVEQLSVDEAFLDVGGAVRSQGSPTSIAESIRVQVREELGCTCSVGVARNKFVAKLASARCKPDGLLVVPAQRTLDFLHPLPVTVLPGVGDRTAEPLHRLGIRTVADLADTPLPTLRRAVGTATADHLHALAQGRDERVVQVGDAEKSISADHTTEADLTSEAEVLRELLRLCDEVAGRVRARCVLARTVAIKIRFADFTTVTRARTLPGWIDGSGRIYQTAAGLYRGLGLDRPRIRLVGVSCENLRAAGSAPQQLSFDDLRHGAEWAGPGVDASVDAARTKFGSAAVGYAALLDTPERGEPGAGARRR